MRYVLLAWFALLWALPAQAQNINYWSESWEGTEADITTRWGTTGSSGYEGWCCTAGLGGSQPFFLDSATKFDSSASLRFNYVGTQKDTPPQGGGFASRNYRNPCCGVKEIWLTWYSRMSAGFKTAGGNGLLASETKGPYIFMWSPSKGQENGWVANYKWGSRNLTWHMQGIKDANINDPPATPYQTEAMGQNISVLNQADLNWTCYEAHFKLNTPGQADGLYELYGQDITAGTPNRLLARYLNREFTDSTLTGTMPSDAAFYRYRVYRQDGLGQMWYDKLTIDSTRRGCTGGGGPSDTTPPSTVTATASVNSGTQATINWTAATDNVGVTSYQVLRSTGATVPTTVLTTKGGSTPFHVDTTLSPGITYNYRVRAGDAAGNLSPPSTTTSITTPSAASGSFRRTLFVDPFTRADSTDLGTIYDAGYTAQTNAQIGSNQVRGVTVNTRSFETYNGTATPNDQWAQATVKVFTGSQVTDQCIHLRAANAATMTSYAGCIQRNGANTMEIREYTAGTPVVLAGNATQTPVAGDKFRPEVQGTALKLYLIRGTQEILAVSTTDATIASGKTGLSVFVATGGTLTNNDLDDFAMGDFTGTADTGTFDAVSNSAAGNTTNTISWSHTTGTASNRVLAVCAQARDTVEADTAVSSMTYAGQALTVVRSDVRTSGGASFRSALGYLVNPPSGTNTVQITWAGALSSYGVGTATSYSGVDQAAPLDAQAGGTGSGTTASAAITTVADNAVITDCAVLQDVGLTVGAGQTERSNRLTTGTVDSTGSSSLVKAVAGAETMDWTQTASANWAISTISFKPGITTPVVPPAITTVAAEETNAVIAWTGALTALRVRWENGSVTESIMNVIPTLTETISDDFASMASWTTNTGLEALTASGGIARATTLNTAAGSTHNTSVGADQYAQVTIPAWAGSSDQFAEITVRWDKVANSGYLCGAARTASGGEHVYINKRTAGVQENLAFVPTDLAAGDVFRCHVIGTVIVATLNGTPKLSAVDASNTYPTGQVGLLAFVTSGSVSDFTFDTFRAGTASAGGTYTYPANVKGTLTNFICYDAMDAIGQVYNTICDSVPFTAADTLPIVMSGAFPSTDLPAGTTSATFGFNLDKAGLCRWSTTDLAYDVISPLTNQMNVASLTATATASVVTGVNTFYGRCLFTNTLDAEFPNLSSIVITVTVAAATADVTAPSTVADLVGTAISNSQVNLVWTAATDAGGIAGYQVSQSLDGTTYAIASGPSLVTTTSIQLALSPGVLYYFKVKAVDTSNNLSAAFSNVVTVTTSAPVDITPPSIMANLRTGAILTQSAELLWDTGTDVGESSSGAVFSTIEISPAGCTDYAPSPNTSNVSSSHLALTLSPGTSYCARGFHTDPSGNRSLDFSNEITFTTSTIGVPQPRPPLPFGVERGAVTPTTPSSVITPHSYIWRADGNSATQGSGSISNWPTLTNSTASCALSQVTDYSTLPTRTPLSGDTTLHYIKMVCTGGASGGTIDVFPDIPNAALTNVGNFGIFWYQSELDAASITGWTMWLTSDLGFASSFQFNANTGSVGKRRTQGWNLFQWKRGDQNTTVGGELYSNTFVYARLQLTIAAGTSFTAYFSDIIRDYVARPQIMVWSADNDTAGTEYANIFGLMNSANYNIKGSYAPTGDAMLVPTGSSMTLLQMAEMRAAGWTWHGHQSNSSGLNYTTMSAADLRTEVALVKAQLGQAGVTTISPIYVYPGGNRNAATDAILAEYGFTGPHVGGNVSSDPNGLPWYGGAIYPYIWNYSCDAVSAAVCQAAISHAVNYGESLAILYHINPTAQCDAACFRSTMDMLNAMRSGGTINLTTFDGVYSPTSGVSGRTPRP